MKKNLMIGIRGLLDGLFILGKAPFCILMTLGCYLYILITERDLTLCKKSIYEGITQAKRNLKFELNWIKTGSQDLDILFRD